MKTKGELLINILKRKKVGDYVYESGTTASSIRKIEIIYIHVEGNALLKYVDGNTFYAHGEWTYYETKEDAIKHSIELCENLINDCNYEIKKLKAL